jgi:tetratricopeptide (TPR) repeat protein
MTSPLPPLARRRDARLREVPVDRDAFERALDALLDEIATARSQPARLLAMLAEAAPLLLAAGRIDDARKTASAAIALAELIEDGHAVFASRIALAQAMQREGRFEIATALFEQLISQARTSPSCSNMLHAILFEAGTNLLDQERPAEAARCFRESQSLRRELGLETLLEESAEALRVTSASRPA